VYNLTEFSDEASLGGSWCPFPIFDSPFVVHLQTHCLVSFREMSQPSFVLFDVGQLLLESRISFSQAIRERFQPVESGNPDAHMPSDKYLTKDPTG
jgi:hypothetical protein